MPHAHYNAAPLPKWERDGEQLWARVRAVPGVGDGVGLKPPQTYSSGMTVTVNTQVFSRAVSA